MTMDLLIGSHGRKKSIYEEIHAVDLYLFFPDFYTAANGAACSIDHSYTHPHAWMETVYTGFNSWHLWTKYKTQSPRSNLYGCI